jgi:hypothetical protein
VVTVAVYLAVATDVLDAAISAPVFLQVLASPLLMAFYAVAVYPFALLQASLLLITTPLLLLSLLFLRPYCCLRSFVAVVLLLLSSLRHIDGLAAVSVSIVHAFCGVLLLLVSLLLKASPASAFVPTVADSLYVAFLPAVAGFTCSCIRLCC